MHSTFKNVCMRISFLCFCFLFIWSFGVGQSNEEAILAYNKAVDHYTQGQYKKAVVQFSKAIKLAPESNDGYLYRGISNIELEKYDLAIQDFDFILNKNRKHKDALEMKGYALQMLELYETAAFTYDELYQLDPSNLDIKKTLALCYIQSKAYDKAIPLYEDLIQINNKDSIAIEHLLYAYEQTNQLQKANNIIVSYLDKHPNSTTIAMKAIENYTRLKQLDMAQLLTTDLIRTYPDQATWYIERGKIHLEKEAYRRALMDFSLAQNNDSKNLSALNGKLKAFKQLKDTVNIIATLDQLHTTEATNPIYAYNIGTLYYKKSDFTQSKEAFSKTVHVDSTYAKAYYYRAFCNYKLDDNAQACSDMEQAKTYGIENTQKWIKLFCK